MKHPILNGLFIGLLVVGGIGFIFYSLATGDLKLGNAQAVTTCFETKPEPRIHTMQCGASILKLMLLDDADSCRLHLLMPLPITGESASVVDIRKVMERVRRGK